MRSRMPAATPFICSAVAPGGAMVSASRAAPAIWSSARRQR
jgi:hypothetical protein